MHCFQIARIIAIEYGTYQAGLTRTRYRVTCKPLIISQENTCLVFG